jgi:hypothetical protein
LALQVVKGSRVSNSNQSLNKLWILEYTANRSATFLMTLGLRGFKGEAGVPGEYSILIVNIRNTTSEMKN